MGSIGIKNREVLALAICALALLCPSSSVADSNELGSLVNCFANELTGHSDRDAQTLQSKYQDLGNTITNFRKQNPGEPARLSTDPEIRSKLSDVLKNAKALLAKEGVDSEIIEWQGVKMNSIDWKDHTALKIIPGDQSAFNRYAKGIRKYDTSMQVIYDPVLLQITPGLAAAVDSKTSTLYLGTDDVILAQPRSSMVKHETQHLRYLGLVKKGQPLPFSSNVHSLPMEDGGAMLRLPGSTGFGLYTSYLNFEELLAYRSNLRDQVKNFLQSPTVDNQEPLLRTLQTRDRISQVADNTISLVLTALKHVESSEEELSFVQTAGLAVYFAEWNYPDEYDVCVR